MTNTNFGSSAYWFWMSRLGSAEGDEIREYPEANPDVLPEYETEEDYDFQMEQRELINNILEKLSHREREVLTLMAKGAVEEQVADLLKISRRSVRTHMSRIKKKAEKVVAIFNE